MKQLITVLLIVLFVYGCVEKETPKYFNKYDETADLTKQQEHQNPRMKFKLFQSKYLDMNEVFQPFDEDLADFTEDDYQMIKPWVVEQDIPSIQKSIREGQLTYEKLTLFYLYRIRKFESDSTKSLNAIIALNPNVVNEARRRDQNAAKNKSNEFSVYGMPILLKDNINTKGMPTTAGALALVDNKNTEDAFIVQRLKEEGALILGKVNLSEWAYYFCSGCPLGYSAVGGQTLNPYGRGEFETGGSSAASGVAVAANYAVAAIGTETAGSITSPSSQNSVVGLKPTVGLLSRAGIVPISSTLDTPGPMTKSVLDNWILINAMYGFDENDPKSYEYVDKNYGTFQDDLKGKRFGVIPSYLQDSVFAANVEMMKKAGAEIVEITPPQVGLPDFLTLLNADMKKDLPEYLAKYADSTVAVRSVKDVMDYNLQDTILRAPYGQQLFEAVEKDATKVDQLQDIKNTLKANARTYFSALDSENLDAILSINNYHSAYSAVAEYPNITIPMGYKESGEPISMTFIVKEKEEARLYVLGMAFEKLTQHRKVPENYK
jgi:amidase